jgi:hypothetical protein
MPGHPRIKGKSDQINAGIKGNRYTNRHAVPEYIANVSQTAPNSPAAGSSRDLTQSCRLAG